MNPKKTEKKLGRPSNSDMLPIPRGAMKQIKAISDEARIPVAQVFEDVVENGLHTVRGMYASLINFRKARAKLNEQKSDEPMAETEFSDTRGCTVDEQGITHVGTHLDGPDAQIPDEFRGAPEPEAGHSDALERSGLGENGEVAIVFDEAVDTE